ncbi:Protein SIEVE ELEMENT OCCLUSION C [Linum perenne]
MNWFVNSGSSFGEGEDVLIKQLLLSHDPDGRWLDSEQLISAVESVMSSASTTPTVQQQQLDVDGIEWNDDEDGIEIVGSEETLGHILWKIMSQCKVFVGGEMSQHSRTMALFDVVGTYKWDAKVVLVLAAFAASYGRFWLVKQQLHHQNSPVAILRHLPRELVAVGPRFKALDLLFKTMVDVAKLMIKFEGLPFRHVKLDVEPIGTTKNCIYVAAYWVVRCSFSCFSMVSDFTAMKQPEKVHVLFLPSLRFLQKNHMKKHSNSTTVAAWEMLSLESRLSKICSHLSGIVDTCHRRIEAKMHQKLPTLFWEEHSDNQEVLEILLALKDHFPLKHPSTKSKISVSELKDKVVMLLISKPQLLPLDELLLLVHQTYGHPHHDDFEVVWVPITESDNNKWSDAEVERFNMLSSSLPGYSVRRPWTLHSAVVSYIRFAWQSRADPAMVVLDSRGAMTNLNAMDMVLIWGASAFPFSAVREQELLAEQKHLTLEFLVDDIDPLLTKWVEKGKNICIYGGEDLEWIEELNARAREITSCGIQLEMVYVGSSNLNENVIHIAEIINETMHRTILSVMKLRFFWLRIKSMRSAKLQQGGRLRHDHILQDVSALLKDVSGWAVIGRGSAEEIVRLEGREAVSLLSKVHQWGEKVKESGFVGALRSSIAVKPTPLHCNRLILPGSTGSIPDRVVCAECGRAMEKFIMYRCCTD